MMTTVSSPEVTLVEQDQEQKQGLERWTPYTMICGVWTKIDLNDLKAGMVIHYNGLMLIVQGDPVSYEIQRDRDQYKEGWLQVEVKRPNQRSKRSGRIGWKNS